MTETNISDKDKKNSFIFTKIFLWIVMLPLMLVRAILKYEAFGYAVKGILILVIIMGFPIRKFLEIAIRPYSLVILIGAIIIDLISAKYREKKESEDSGGTESLAREKSKKEKKIILDTLDLVFEDLEIHKRIEDFIAKNTKNYEEDRIGEEAYEAELDKLLDYLNRKTQGAAKIPVAKGNRDLVRYWNKNGPLLIDKEMLKLYIENKKHI